MKRYNKNVDSPIKQKSPKQHRRNFRIQEQQPANLSVSTERKGLVPFPSSSPRWPGFRIQVTLSTKATVLLPSRSESTELTMLLHTITDPVNSWIIADSVVGRVDENDLKVFEGRVLAFPSKQLNVRRVKKNKG